MDNDMKKVIKEKWYENVNTLSGGNKQIVSIIRSLIKPTKILILDDPTSNLDTDKIEWFYNTINSIKKASQRLWI